MAPNVYGMSQFADGGIFSTKPYIAGANYILKMSNYGKSAWSETVTGLYWRFMAKNEAVFAKNPRMSMIIRTLHKMPETKREEHYGKAEAFIEKVTF